ncbi:unnamed protein product [Rhizophagus irregularis]|nr:unnamed protein product [Rhizophagus irregularis]CAB5393953.1 unnamed protein product [Rhizophagus irregularis]
MLGYLHLYGPSTISYLKLCLQGITPVIIDPQFSALSVGIFASTYIKESLAKNLFKKEAFETFRSNDTPAPSIPIKNNITKHDTIIAIILR